MRMFWAALELANAQWVLISLIAFVFVLLLLVYLARAEAKARQAHAVSESVRRESDERWRLILESVRDYAIFTTDMKGRVVSWNSGAERVFGYAESEIMHQHLSVLFTPEDIAGGAPEIEMRQALQTGVARDERWHVRKNGSRFFVNGALRPMHDSEGQTVGFVKVAQDITSQRQIEEKLRRETALSESIINSLPGIFYLFDRQGKCLRWNINTERVTGYSNADIGQRSPLNYFNEADKERAAASIQEAFETGRSTLEADLITRDGHHIPHLFTGLRVDWDGAPCLIGMGIDISVRRRAEEELRRTKERLREYASTLEQRVAERTTRLQQSLESLEGVLYHVAHDLRAPLRAMASFTNILLKEHSAQLDADGADYVRRIFTAAGHMDELVQDLLAYGRLAHTPVPLAPVNLEAHVDRVVQRFSKEIHARRAEVNVRRPLPAVQANGEVLAEVLCHLLDNALKFVAPAKAPHVRIWAENGGRVRLWIEDNGLGIKPEFHDRIFRVFERLHAQDAYGGTGIGLAIVRKGLERMGGNVGLESRDGKGSLFWVELPAATGNGEPG